ncbi:unnamed protein product [Hermetia illucens]|uniref:Major facilitator superfamily (MFS) profile domain-containing protein n=1 Tax=Hermetia illucens TaxID=343691 RepID=A0A7R8V4R2_HERIL|nr:unnamed protein product [Hermetia illucens]
METRFRSNRIATGKNLPQPPKIFVNDRPHNFFRNGTRRVVDNQPELGEFRRALPQFIAVGVKNILLFVYGMTLGFPTIVIPAIQGGDGREPSDIVLSRDEISWFSSINLICVPLGCIFSGAFTSPIGKRKAMQLVNFPILASWLLFHFSTSTGYLYAGLCLSGLSGGLMEAPVLTYVAEITEPKYRGMLAASGSACVILGVFIQFVLGSILDWRTIAAVSTVFPVISIIALFFVPESPHWLIRMNRFPEAVKSLTWLRGWVPEYKVEAEFNELYDSIIVKPSQEQAAEEVKRSPVMKYLRLFKKRSFLSPFCLILLTFFIGHFSGKTTLQTYAVQIFHTLKTPVDKYHATILLGLAELIGTILCIVLIHFTGKRPLVFASTIGCGLCIFGTATYAYFLKSVPGFAIANVVTNASSLVPQENIITLQNVTDIFDKEEEALERSELLSVLRLKPETIITTIPPELPETTTILYLDYFDGDFNATNSSRRLIRSADFEDNFNITDDYFDFTNTGNSPDFEVDSNQTDFLNYDVFNETTQDNTEPPVLIDLDEILNPLEDNPEIHKKILVPVPKQKKKQIPLDPADITFGLRIFRSFGNSSYSVDAYWRSLPGRDSKQCIGNIRRTVSFVGTILLYFLLPETEGRSLSDIEKEFSGNRNKQPKESEDKNVEDETPPNARNNLQQMVSSGETMWTIPTDRLNFDASRLANGRDLKQTRTRWDCGEDNKAFTTDEFRQNTTKL